MNIFSILSLIISIITVIFLVLNFALNRKDKAVVDTEKHTQETADQKLIDYRLKQVELKLDKVLDILDGYDKEIDERVDKAMAQHILLYHKGGE